MRCLKELFRDWLGDPSSEGRGHRFESCRANKFNILLDLGLGASNAGTIGGARLDCFGAVGKRPEDDGFRLDLGRFDPFAAPSGMTGVCARTKPLARPVFAHGLRRVEI